MLYAAHHPDAPLRSLTVMTTPTDLQEMGPMGDALGASGVEVEDTFNGDGNVAPEVLLQAFRSLTPTADITGYVNLWQQMWNDDYVSAHQAMSGWGATTTSRSPGRRQAVGGDDEGQRAGQRPARHRW